VAALIVLRGLPRRTYDFGPARPTVRNYPMQVDQLNGWGLYRRP